MKELISQGLFFLAEIGVIVVMLIIIVRERRKRKETEFNHKRTIRNNSLPKSQTLYLDWLIPDPIPRKHQQETIQQQRHKSAAFFMRFENTIMDPTWFVDRPEPPDGICSCTGKDFAL
jgi:hypothetical protein